MIKIRSHNRYSGCEEAIAHLEHIELKEAIALGIFKTGMRSHLGYEDAIALHVFKLRKCDRNLEI